MIYIGTAISSPQNIHRQAPCGRSGNRNGKPRQNQTTKGRGRSRPQPSANKKRPGFVGITGRPNSPPPELLAKNIQKTNRQGNPTFEGWEIARKSYLPKRIPGQFAHSATGPSPVALAFSKRIPSKCAFPKTAPADSKGSSALTCICRLKNRLGGVGGYQNHGQAESQCCKCAGDFNRSLPL
jgi:hypothetical protein